MVDIKTFTYKHTNNKLVFKYSHRVIKRSEALYWSVFFTPCGTAMAGDPTSTLASLTLVSFKHLCSQEISD